MFRVLALRRKEVEVAGLRIWGRLARVLCMWLAALAGPDSCLGRSAGSSSAVSKPGEEFGLATEQAAGHADTPPA